MEVIKNNDIPFTPKQQLNDKNSALDKDLQHSINFNSMQKEKIKNERKLLNKHILRLYRLKK